MILSQIFLLNRRICTISATPQPLGGTLHKSLSLTSMQTNGWDNSSPGRVC